MTTEEKLQHFLQSSMERSREESNQIIEDYTVALDKIFEEHKADRKRKANLEIKMEQEHIHREGNKQLAQAQLGIKRKLSKKESELTEKLFVEVNDLLEQYMSTDAYTNLLVKQINDAKAFANKFTEDEEMIVYLDPADENRQFYLQNATGISLTISQYSFGGGTRAVLPNHNILIDNSFESKLEEAKENFRFTGGISHVK